MPTITNDSFDLGGNTFQTVLPANQGDSFESDTYVFNNTLTTSEGFESDSNVVAARRSNTIYDTWVSPVTGDQAAYAYIFENIQLSSRDSAAQAYIFENVTSDIPSPHIWYVFPDEGVRGQVIVVVGHGFGATQGLYNGKVTFGPTTPDILTWMQSPPSLNPLPGIIDPADDLADPEHQRVTFAIPNNAVSGDVRVITNTDLVYSPPPTPPVAKFDSDTAAAVESESSTVNVTSTDTAAAVENDGTVS